MRGQRTSFKTPGLLLHRHKAGPVSGLLLRVGPAAISDEQIHLFPSLQVDPIAKLVEELPHELPGALRRKSAEGAVLAQGQKRLRIVTANALKPTSRPWPVHSTFCDRVTVSSHVVNLPEYLRVKNISFFSAQAVRRFFGKRFPVPAAAIPFLLQAPRFHKVDRRIRWKLPQSFGENLVIAFLVLTG